MEFYRNITTHTVNNLQTITFWGQVYLVLVAMFFFKLVFFLGHLFMRKALFPSIHWLVKRVNVSVSFQDDTKGGGGSSKQT